MSDRMQKAYVVAKIITMVAPWLVLLMCVFGCLWVAIAAPASSVR